MFGFKCKHPFSGLVVEKSHTTEVKDADFEHVDYHLSCISCGEKLTIKHASLIGGVDGFMNRNHSK
jgi:hypothetical protein